jgi:hypothetical protein
MAKVPTYGADLIDTAAMPGVRQTSGASPDAFFNDGGAGMIGKGLQQAGNAMMDIAIREKKTEDEAVVKRADIEYAARMRKILHDPGDGYLNALGERAVAGREAVTKQIEETNREFRERFAQEPARSRAWSMIEGARTESALGNVDVHASRQLQVFAAGQAEARAKAQIPDMVANAATEGKTDPETGRPVGPFATAKATMLSEIQTFGEKTGKSQAEIDNLKKALLTDAHTQVIQDLVATKDAKRAQDYFKKYSERGEILADKQAEIKKVIDNELVRTSGLDLSMQIGATVKGGESAQLAEVDKQYKAGTISAEVRDNAKTRIEHDWSKRRSNQNESDKFMMGSAQEWVLKNPGKSVLEMPSGVYNWAKSTGHLAGLDSFATREGRPGERMTEIKVRGQLITMATSDPDAFIAEFKRTQFSDRLDLGVQGIKEMQNIAGDMLKNNGKYKTSFDPKVMLDAMPPAIRNGKDKDQQDAFTALQHEAQTRWSKANPGKQPTAEDQRKVANEANAEWVSIGSVWNSSAKAYKLRQKPDDKAVPKDFFDGMKKAGAKDDEILAAWKLKNGTK